MTMGSQHLIFYLASVDGIEKAELLEQSSIDRFIFLFHRESL